MQRHTPVFGVFGHIVEQEKLFKSHGCAGIGEVIKETWHARCGSSPGVLVDTGAVRPLIDSAFVESRLVDMQKHGFAGICEPLLHPEYMRGIGRGSQMCSRAVHRVGALHDGGVTGKSSPVLDKDESAPESAFVPFLHSFAQLFGMNGLFDAKLGRPHCAPGRGDV